MRRSLLTGVVAVLVLSGCSRDGSFATDRFSPVRSGSLTVVTNLPAPGFWRGETADEVDGGFEYGIAREMAKQLGLDLEVRQVSFSDLVNGRVRRYDVGLSQVAVTQSRSGAVDFSVPYFTSDAGILTRTSVKIPDLKTARDQRWVVQRSTVESAFLEDVVKPSRRVLEVDTIDDAVAALERDDADAALLDTVTALAEAHASADGLAVPAQFALRQQFAVVLPNGSDNRIAVDKEIRRMRSNGTLADLERRWIRPVTGGVDPSDVPTLVTKEASS